MKNYIGKLLGFDHEITCLNNYIQALNEENQRLESLLKQEYDKKIGQTVEIDELRGVNDKDRVLVYIYGYDIEIGLVSWITQRRDRENREKK